MEPVLNAYRLTTDDRNFADIWRNQILYDISLGNFSPIAIRDQIIRSYITVERAIEEGFIGLERPLLIIGGGITGVSAAYHATKNNIPTYLVEKDVILNKVFNFKRYVCPTLYDFPALHWNSKRFPLEGENSRIKFQVKAGELNRLKSHFNKYKRELENTSLFNLLEYAEVSEIEINSVIDNLATASVKIEFVNFGNGSFRDKTEEKLRKNIKELRFGMILSCIGYSKERNYVEKGDDFSGISFWEFPIKNFNPRDLKKIICGSGDGALQDFLLIVTGMKSAREIYEKIDLTGEIRTWVETNLREVEQDANRSYAWQTNKRRNELGYKAKKAREHNDLLRIYSKVEAIAMQVLGRYDSHTNFFNYDGYFPSSLIISKDDSINIEKSINGLVRKYLGRGNKVNIAYTCNHFSRGYILNHFLAILIGKFIEKFHNETVFLPNICITAVKPLDDLIDNHDCSTSSELECFLNKHRIWGVESNCFITKEEVKEKVQIEDYILNNVIYDKTIIRFGLEKSKSPFAKLLAPYNDCYLHLGGFQNLPLIFPKY